MGETPRGPAPAVRRHPRIFYFGVPLTAVVLALLAAELGLRILHPIPYSLEQNMVFEADPDTGYRASRYDFSMPQAMLSALFGERHVPVIDLLPAFLADPRCPLYMNNTHWNPAGHVLAAEAIAPALRSWIPAR